MTTEERLEKLERELARPNHPNCWLLPVIALAVVGLALAGTWTRTTAIAQDRGESASPKVIHASAFSLEDENGKVRATLSMTKGGPRLALYDENGKVRVGLGASKDGSGLSLYDENDKQRLLLAATKDAPALALYNETGKVRATLLVAKSMPGLRLLDPNGNGGVVLGVTKDGPALALCDENRKAGAMLDGSKDGPKLRLFDRNGTLRAALAAFKDQPLLGFLDENGRPRLALAGSKDGPTAIEPQLCTTNSAGHESSVPVSALALLFDEYRSGNLGGGTTVIGVPYGSPPSMNTPMANPLNDFMSGLFREMGRQMASPN